MCALEEMINAALQNHAATTNKDFMSNVNILVQKVCIAVLLWTKEDRHIAT